MVRPRAVGWVNVPGDRIRVGFGENWLDSQGEALRVSWSEGMMSDHDNRGFCIRAALTALLIVLCERSHMPLVEGWKGEVCINL